ncbi:hypothetical protein HG263_11015 [Pseudoalteromonas sp. JBTF-M23]|uniref:Uncharacterized protein n=1 Tax=Pseudoalteromonas caenipelagi TaxID=2726988 RepID=A0A849VE43_9GAMM|nr:hypothetical protein [Pseudoalteromonas caenipelagi]NOU51058.1 hypothetical protein [Pseudoalteromonas caenipelagi]
MLGQLKTRMLVLSAIVVMSTGFVFQDEATLALTKHDNCTCKTTDGSAAQYCETEKDINWYSWFMGQSGSAQFHYLDLLELLLGSDRQSDSGISSRPGL